MLTLSSADKAARGVQILEKGAEVLSQERWKDATGLWWHRINADGDEDEWLPEVQDGDGVPGVVWKALARKDRSGNARMAAVDTVLTAVFGPDFTVLTARRGELKNQLPGYVQFITRDAAWNVMSIKHELGHANQRSKRAVDAAKKAAA
eukprot:SAG31_NODE_22295_length_529_cov_0.760465_1_plen_148_part_01